MRPINLFCLLVLLTSLAVAQNAPTVEQAESACGPSNIKFNVKTSPKRHPLAPAETGKAQVYVIGDIPGHAGLFNLDPTIRVGLDGKWVGADEDLSYMFFPVDPGDHHLCVRVQTQHTDLQYLISLAKFTALTDRTYYFRVQLQPYGGKVGFELKLEPLDSDEANLLLARYPHAVSTAKK